MYVLKCYKLWFSFLLLLSHVFTDSFVNSQEWTLSRSVPELRLGIVGSINSGKSALVHRYLTGSYMQEESPEGGRFKKEIFIDNQSYLLLIRDEGGMPEMQVGVFHHIECVRVCYTECLNFQFHTLRHIVLSSSHKYTIVLMFIFKLCFLFPVFSLG